MEGPTRMFVGWTASEPFKRWACPNCSQSKVQGRVKTPTAFDKTAAAFAKMAAAFAKTATAFAIVSLLPAWILVKRCIRAAYFLADSWFDGIDFIKGLREIAAGALHVICMTKNGNWKYEYMGRKHAGKQIVTMNERHSKPCRQYKCRYFKADVTFEGV